MKYLIIFLLIIVFVPTAIVSAEDIAPGYGYKKTLQKIANSKGRKVQTRNNCPRFAPNRNISTAISIT